MEDRTHSSTHWTLLVVYMYSSRIHVSVQHLVDVCCSFIWAASVAGKIRGFGKAFELLSINRRFLSPLFPHLRTSMYSTTSANPSSGRNNDTRHLKQKVLWSVQHIVFCSPSLSVLLVSLSPYPFACQPVSSWAVLSSACILIMRLKERPAGPLHLTSVWGKSCMSDD